MFSISSELERLTIKWIITCSAWHSMSINPLLSPKQVTSVVSPKISIGYIQEPSSAFAVES